jgi:hypothetical protein
MTQQAANSGSGWADVATVSVGSFGGVSPTSVFAGMQQDDGDGGTSLFEGGHLLPDVDAATSVDTASVPETAIPVGFQAVVALAQQLAPKLLTKVQVSRHSTLSSLDGLLNKFSSVASPGVVRFLESESSMRGLLEAFSSLKRKSGGQMDTDPLAPPADSRAVVRDLHSVLFPQKSYMAASVLPSGVLPNDLPASVTKSGKAAGSAGRAKDLELF